MGVSVRAPFHLAWLFGVCVACGGGASSTPARSVADQPAALGATSAPGEDRAARVAVLLDSSRALGRHQMWPQAEVDLRKALELSFGFAAPWPEYRADALSQLAGVLVEQKRYREARGFADEALEQLHAGALAEDRHIYGIQRTRAEAFAAEGQPSAVTSALAAAIAAAERHSIEMSNELVEASLALAAHLQGSGQALQATKTLERALGVTKSGSQRSLGARVADPLAKLYDASGEPKRAQDLRSEYGLSAPPVAATGTATESVRGIAAMQADFRACYQASLEHEGSVEGGVKLVIRVAADGRVQDVKADGLKLPRSTVDCLLKRAALARFEPPKGGSATITVPVTFVKQD